MQTLEIRESRSSLAGVLMAAALEGASLAVLVDHAQAAATPDPTAQTALAQLTQNQQAVAPPGRSPTDPADVGSAARRSTRRRSRPRPRPSTCDRHARAERPGRRSSRARRGRPAAGRRRAGARRRRDRRLDARQQLDRRSGGGDHAARPPATGQSVQFLPAVTQTDPVDRAGRRSPVAPVVAEAPAAPAAPAQPVTGVLQQVAEPKAAVVQAQATVLGDARRWPTTSTRSPSRAARTRTRATTPRRRRSRRGWRATRRRPGCRPSCR